MGGSQCLSVCCECYECYECCCQSGRVLDEYQIVVVSCSCSCSCTWGGVSVCQFVVSVMSVMSVVVNRVVY